MSGIPLGVLQVITRAAYSGRTPLKVAGFELIRSSPTLKFYKRDDLIIVSVRGTDPRDPKDLQADAMSVYGKVRGSPRVKDDLALLREVQTKYPKGKYRYTGVGHSLGGAILDVFLRDKLINNALSYNPMIEPQERKSNPLHRRIYNEQDPLYLMFGRHVPNVEVRKSNDPLWKIWLTYKLPPVFKQLFTLYDKHRLQSFKGGAKTISDALGDVYPKRPMSEREDILEERDVPVTKTVRKSVPNPAFWDAPKKQRSNQRLPPPDGMKGVPQRITADVDEVTMTRQKVKVGERKVNDRLYDEIDELEKDLRGLAHFYGFRDPATSLGFRVMADEIKNTLPTYKNRPKKANDDQHNKAQYFSGMLILGQNAKARAMGFAQPNPQERFDEEVLPFFRDVEEPKIRDPANPISSAKATPQYAIPPRTRVEKELLLQQYPQIKGKTMYLDSNK